MEKLQLLITPCSPIRPLLDESAFLGVIKRETEVRRAAVQGPVLVPSCRAPQGHVRTNQSGGGL